MQTSKLACITVLGVALLSSGSARAQWDLSAAGAGTKMYTDPAGKFSLRIPAYWQVSMKNGVCVFQWDKSAVTFLDRPGETDTTELLENSTQTIRETGKDYKQEEPTALSLSSWNGRTVLFRATGPDGTAARGRAVALSAGDDGLVVILTSSPSAFHADDAAFTRALATLEMRASKPITKFLLAENTPVHLMLTRDIKSGRDRKGTTLHFRVASDVLSTNGQVVIAKNADATGRVLRSEKRRMFGKPGKLDISVESAVAVDGSMVPLRATQKITQRGDNNVTAVAVSAVLLTPLTLFVHGRDVTMKEGTEVTVYVDQDTMIASAPPATTAAASQTSPRNDEEPEATAAPDP